jgi:hypothetical protein
MQAIVDEANEFLDAAAQRIGAQKLVMESPRPGWQRKGWKIREYQYERQVWPKAAK